MKNLRGVDLDGDGDTPAGSGLAVPLGYGLGHGLVADDRAGVFFTEGTWPGVPLLLDDLPGVGVGLWPVSTIVVLLLFVQSLLAVGGFP